MIVGHLRNSLRLVRIMGLMLGHGVFSRRVSEAERGRRIARTLEAMGPSFVKLGQAFSTRSDLVGQEMALALSDLQDRLPPFPGEVARAIVSAQLGAPVETLFSSFDDTAVAAASVAQVHFAVLQDGREVAVKVLRPEIEKAFARDLALFYWLAGIAERWRPDWYRLHLSDVVRLMEETVRAETDLRMEAASATRLRENLKHDEGFFVPQVFWAHTAQRVLTLERIRGIPVSNVQALRERGHNLSGLVDAAAVSLFKQVFRDGFFHADLHPGNLFVMDNGVLAVVDFGIMGRLDKRTRVYLAQILHGFLTEDYHNLAKVHFDVGLVPPHKSQEAFELALMAITKPIIGHSLNEISVARLLGQLLSTAEAFEMEVQPHLLLLQKNMMITEGVGRMLHPSVNMWQVAEPLIHQWAIENLGPKARIREHAEDTLSLLKLMPGLVSEARTLLSRPARPTDQPPRPEERMTPYERERLKLQRRCLWLGWAALATIVLASIT